MEELELPRPPGVIRRFWARHPLFADILIALVCLFLSAAPTTVLSTSGSTSIGGGAASGTATLSEPQLITGNIVLTIIIVAANALLLRRRQWPIAVFVAAFVVAFAHLLLLAPSTGPLLLVAGYSLAVHRSTKAAWIGFGIGLGSLALVSGLLALFDAIAVQEAVNVVAGALALALIGTLVGANIGGRKRYLEALIDRSRQLMIERDQRAQLAASAERARIAREMHDVVSHSLTVIVALSEGAAATADPVRARDASATAAATARGALTEMRAMLGVLRSTGADAEHAPLAPVEPVDPHTTVEAAQRAGYPATLVRIGDTAAAPDVEHAIGRIVQEGVTNAMRHADATRITVRVDRTADPIVVSVDNDGATAPSQGAGFGLRGIAERAAHVGGTIQAGPSGDGRWVLRAELPGAPAETEDA